MHAGADMLTGILRCLRDNCPAVRTALLLDSFHAAPSTVHDAIALAHAVHNPSSDINSPQYYSTSRKEWERNRAADITPVKYLGLWYTLFGSTPDETQREEEETGTQHRPRINHSSTNPHINPLMDERTRECAGPLNQCSLGGHPPGQAGANHAAQLSMHVRLPGVDDPPLHMAACVLCSLRLPNAYICVHRATWAIIDVAYRP